MAAALDQSGLFVTTAATLCYGATALIRGCDFCTLAASTVRDYRSLVESGWREWWKPSQGQIWPFAPREGGRASLDSLRHMQRLHEFPQVRHNTADTCKRDEMVGSNA